MLVLSRKVGQTLIIDDRITIVVQRIAGNRVSIGIEAPDDVHIMRGELQKIRQEFANDKPAMNGPVRVDVVAEVNHVDLDHPGMTPGGVPAVGN